MSASSADRQQTQVKASSGNAAAAGLELAADLFERHHGEIYAYLCGMLREPAWAEDLAQETFLRVLQARRRLAEVRNHRAWLYRVATNVALNALKRRRRFSWLPWRAGDPELRAPDPAEQAGRRSALEAALGALQPAYRAPLPHRPPRPPTSCRPSPSASLGRWAEAASSTPALRLTARYSP